MLGHTVSQTLFATYHRHCRCRDHHHVKIQSHPYHLDYMPYLHISGQKEKQMCFPKLTQTKIKVPLSSWSTGNVKVWPSDSFFHLMNISAGAGSICTSTAKRRNRGVSQNLPRLEKEGDKKGSPEKMSSWSNGSVKVGHQTAFSI